MTRGTLVTIYDGYGSDNTLYACVSTEFNGDMSPTNTSSVEGVDNSSAGKQALQIVENVKTVGDFIDEIIKFRGKHFEMYDEPDDDLWDFAQFEHIKNLGGIGDVITSEYVYVKNLSSVDVVFKTYKGITIQIPSGFYTVIDVNCDSLER